MTNIFIQTDVTQPVSVVQVKGRIDSDTTTEFENSLSNLLNTDRNKIVLDLQAVDYLSSAGLRALVKALKAAQNSGGGLHLAGVSEQVEVIFRTVGMLQMFKMFSTTEEAVAGF